MKRLVRIWQVFQPLQCLRAILALRTVPGVLLAIAIAAPGTSLLVMRTQGEF